jgi:membrane fusion protein (multidrug efflux system)
MRLQLIVGAALCLAVLSTSGCSDKGAEEAAKQAAAPPPPTPVVVADVVRAEVPVIREYVARTEAKETVVVQARVEAILKSMEFEEGKPVEAGQVLYRLDSQTYDANLEEALAGLARAQADLKLAVDQVSVRAAEAAVNKAKAALGKANADVARLRPLAEQDAVPRQDLDTAVSEQEVAEAELEAQEAELENSRIREEVGILQARAQLKGAEAAVALAELDVSYCTITCPIDGLIGRTEVDVGNLVGRDGSSELVTVSSIDPMRATLSISEEEFLKFQEQDRKKKEEGRPVQLLLADNTVYEHEGRIITAERAVSIETGTLQLVAEFPNPGSPETPGGNLRAGQFGRIRAIVGILKDAVLVPQRAVMEQQSAKIVYVVEDDGKVALRSVQLGERHKDSFVVLDGLEGGEKVIIEGQIKVRPGMTAEPTDKAASSEPEGN